MAIFHGEEKGPPSSADALSLLVHCCVSFSIGSLSLHLSHGLVAIRSEKEGSNWEIPPTLRRGSTPPARRGRRRRGRRRGDTMRPLTSAVPPCGGGGGRRPTAPPAGCSRLSAVAAAVTAAASTESGNPPALLVFCKTPPHSSSVRAGICLVGIFSGVNKNNCARANNLAHDLAGNQQSTNQSISCASFGTVQVAKNPSKDNTLHRKCATEGVVAEATRSAATVGCRQAAAIVRKDWIAIESPSKPINVHQPIEIDSWWGPLMGASDPSVDGPSASIADGERAIASRARKGTTDHLR